MTQSPEVITGLAVAIGVGLLIGIERERAKGSGADRAVAGIRTFTLLGLLGALARLVGDDGVLVVGIFVAMAVMGSYRRTRTIDQGLTTEVAMVVTFVLGVLAVRGAAIAAGMGVLVTLVLAAKSRMHRFTRQALTTQELHDLLLLAAAAFVVLPLLPDRAIDPWGALNPHRIWLLVVAVMAVSSAAYVALRVFGARLGLALAGLAGGFVSSTATIVAMGDGARADPASNAAFASAGLLSNVASIIQMAVVLATLSPPLLVRAAWPLAAAGAMAAGAAAVNSWRTPSTSGDAANMAGKRPFDPKRVLGFVAVLTSILLLAAIARQWLGGASLPWFFAALGLADVHAAVASAAQMVSTGEVRIEPALVMILAAITANSLEKCVMAMVRGGWAYASRVVPGIVLMVIAFAVAMAMTRPLPRP